MPASPAPDRSAVPCEPIRSLLSLAERQRGAFSRNQRSDGERQGELGQFLTPAPVARLMARLLHEELQRQALPASPLRLLDAGAGVGALTAALCDAFLSSGPVPAIHGTAFEIDPACQAPLRQVLTRCEAVLGRRGSASRFIAQPGDFLSSATELLTTSAPRFHAAIVNPPYRKLASGSPERRLLRSLGIEASNLYTAFLSLIIRLLEPGGVLCAVTPRSFCNGPYFLPFRRLLLERMRLRDIVVFADRNRLFADDRVLQETLIWVAVADVQSPRPVRLHALGDPQDAAFAPREVPHSQVAPPDDPRCFLHLPLRAPDATQLALTRLPATLADLGLRVSTGRVVDFRARDHLRSGATAAPGEAPLLYPAHLEGTGRVRWPSDRLRKPQALAHGPATRSLLLPAAPMVLVKRFSSKEQRRRLMCAVLDPHSLPGATVAIENHLNVYYGPALTLPVAWGLCAFLSASCVDRHFRDFSGHTQVNATDLRSLRYPSLTALAALGQRVLDQGGTLPDPAVLDALVAGSALE